VAGASDRRLLCNTSSPLPLPARRPAHARNDAMDSRSPAAFLLVGQPTLRRRLRQGALAAVDQRVTLRVHLEGMDLTETGAYLKHHLALAGRSDTLFSDDAWPSSTRPPAACPAPSIPSPSRPWSHLG